MMDWIPIVGKFFRVDATSQPDDFMDYLQGMSPPGWVQFVVLHNTSEPTLAQRPDGFSAQNMADLADFYENTQGWHAGPHLFIDQNGVWVFTPLTDPGVHAPSWNDVSWGVEMLGEYEEEAFDSGPGAQVGHNAVCAIADLCMWKGLDSHTMRLHKEDPNTTHTTCPGHNVDKAAFIQRVHDLIQSRKDTQAS